MDGVNRFKAVQLWINLAVAFVDEITTYDFVLRHRRSWSIARNASTESRIT